METKIWLLSVSDGYSDRDIAFRWENKSNRISIGDKVRTLPQYNLTGFRTLERHTAYVVGKLLEYNLKGIKSNLLCHQIHFLCNKCVTTEGD